jgi:hypothetical protein
MRLTYGDLGAMELLFKIFLLFYKSQIFENTERTHLKLPPRHSYRQPGRLCFISGFIFEAWKSCGVTTGGHLQETEIWRYKAMKIETVGDVFTLCR